MNQASRELKLSEIVRSLHPTHGAYKEYATLIGKAQMLQDLESSLWELSRTCESASSRLSPELQVFNELQLVRAKIAAIMEAQNPRPTDHRLGME